MAVKNKALVQIRLPLRVKSIARPSARKVIQHIRQYFHSVEKKARTRGLGGAEGFRLVDKKRFKNIYWAGSVEEDAAFQGDIFAIIEKAETHGLEDFNRLDEASVDAKAPIFLTDKTGGSKNKSMSTLPCATSAGPAITISVNTRSAIMTLDGGIQSPATGVIHEVNHAINLLRGPGVGGLVYMSELEKRKWTIGDDKAVIFGPESRAARAFGEAIRTSHRVKELINVECATCTE